MSSPTVREYLDPHAASARIPNHNGSTEARPFGVNVSGHLESEKGMGESVRSSIRVLEAAGIPVAVNNVVDAGSANIHGHRSVAEHPYGVNLIHINPEGLPTVMPRMGQAYVEGRYNIGYWTWELAEFPAPWHRWFETFDEIWVPSQFVMDAIAPHATIPVVKVPHAIPVEDLWSSITAQRDGGRDSAGTRDALVANRPTVPRKRPTFLFLFDFSSYWQRKHPFGLVEAFTRAFPERQDVTLLIKTVHKEFSPRAFEELQEACRDPRIELVDGVWSREALLELMSRCECVASLHRAEGFGLALAEAMALGKPVIATGYSGNLEFMNPDNSLPVNFRLTELKEDYGPYPRGSRWADPDIDHAASLMRWVVAHPLQAQDIGHRAVQTIRQSFSPTAIGALVRDRLRIIHSSLLEPRHAGAGCS